MHRGKTDPPPHAYGRARRMPRPPLHQNGAGVPCSHAAGCVTWQLEVVLEAMLCVHLFFLFPFRCVDQPQQRCALARNTHCQREGLDSTVGDTAAVPYGVVTVAEFRLGLDRLTEHCRMAGRHEVCAVWRPQAAGADLEKHGESVSRRRSSHGHGGCARGGQQRRSNVTLWPHSGVAWLGRVRMR